MKKDLLKQNRKYKIDIDFAQVKYQGKYTSESVKVTVKNTKFERARQTKYQKRAISPT